MAADQLSVPQLSIGDEVPNYVGETTCRGEITLHDWIEDSQGEKDKGESVFTLLLTFPPIPDPVTLSEIAWLGKQETRDDLAHRRINVLGIVCCTMFEFKAFLRDVPELIEDETWSVSDTPFLADEDGELHRLLGQVRDTSIERVSRMRALSCPRAQPTVHLCLCVRFVLAKRMQWQVAWRPHSRYSSTQRRK